MHLAPVLVNCLQPSCQHRAGLKQPRVPVPTSAQHVGARWAITTSPNTLITRASRYRPTQHSCNRRIEATLYTSSHVARTNPRSAAMVVNRPSEVLHAPTAPRIDHLPPYNQSRKLNFDSMLSNRCDSVAVSAPENGLQPWNQQPISLKQSRVPVPTIA